MPSIHGFEVETSVADRSATRSGGNTWLKPATILVVALATMVLFTWHKASPSTFEGDAAIVYPIIARIYWIRHGIGTHNLITEVIRDFWAPQLCDPPTNATCASSLNTGDEMPNAELAAIGVCRSSTSSEWADFENTTKIRLLGASNLFRAVETTLYQVVPVTQHKSIEVLPFISEDDPQQSNLASLDEVNMYPRLIAKQAPGTHVQLSPGFESSTDFLKDNTLEQALNSQEVKKNGRALPWIAKRLVDLRRAGGFDDGDAAVIVSHWGVLNVMLGMKHVGSGICVGAWDDWVARGGAKLRNNHVVEVTYELSNANGRPALSPVGCRVVYEGVRIKTEDLTPVKAQGDGISQTSSWGGRRGEHGVVAAGFHPSVRAAVQKAVNARLGKSPPQTGDSPTSLPEATWQGLDPWTILSAAVHTEKA